MLPPNTVAPPIFNHTIPVLPPRASGTKPPYKEHPVPEAPGNWLLAIGIL